MADKKKPKRQARKKKAVTKTEGEGIKEITKDPPVSQGHFKIVEKTLNEEKGEWEYKFEWDEKFAHYAKSCHEDPEKVTPQDMDEFCLNILIARQVEQLEDGVKVRRVDNNKMRRRKFYKKYE